MNGGFVKGTLVHTREGLRPIEEIRVGDYVLSSPEDGTNARCIGQRMPAWAGCSRRRIRSVDKCRPHSQ